MIIIYLGFDTLIELAFSQKDYKEGMEKMEYGKELPEILPRGL